MHVLDSIYSINKLNISINILKSIYVLDTSRFHFDCAITIVNIAVFINYLLNFDVEVIYSTSNIYSLRF